MRVFAFGPAASPRLAARSVRHATASVSIVRPVALTSSFMGNSSGVLGLCSSFSGMSLSTGSRTLTPRRQSVVVEANGKKSMGCNLEGTRRKRVRVSGFRARMQTPAGRRVLAARRKKGRKVLCPANQYVKGKAKPRRR